jgi:L-threonine kinase
VLVVGGAKSVRQYRSGTGTAAGTCGELVQGFTSSGQPFHVTCPIDKTSTVSVTLRPAQEFSVRQTNSHLDKVELSLLRTAEHLNLDPCEIRIAHWTDLELGKGLGSSTADIVAAARALAAAVDRKLTSAELASIATGIESSDGSMYPGLVAFNQKSGAVLRRYTWWPQFLVVIVVPPKKLNTESANFAGKAALGTEFDAILDQLDRASAERDPQGFLDAATTSARLNQRFVPNPHFALLEERLQELGAVGINVGHTGTVVGLLYDINDPSSNRAAAGAAIEVQSMFPDAHIEMALTPPCTVE